MSTVCRTAIYPPIASREVTALYHEVLDHSVEFGSFVAERATSLADTLLTCAESTEIGSSLGAYIVVELHYDPTSWRATNGDVEASA